MDIEIFNKKLNEKVGFNMPDSRPTQKEDVPKNRREASEGHHKSKRCICGLHSVKGYKEKSKYPRWKKTPPTIACKTKEERIIRNIFIGMAKDAGE